MITNHIPTLLEEIVLAPGDKVMILVGSHRGTVVAVHDLNHEGWVRVRPKLRMLWYMPQEVVKVTNR